MSNVLNMVSEQTFVTQTNAIKNAIDAISGGGSDAGFDLLPSGTITVTNGAFSVPYQGTPPANTAKIILVDTPYGVHNNATFSVSFINGVANFSFSSYIGSMTVNMEAIIIVGDYTKKVTVENFPVNYGQSYGDSLKKQPEVELTQDGNDWVGTLDIYPKNVTPAPIFEYYEGIVLAEYSGGSATYADCEIENGTIRISNAPPYSELQNMEFGNLYDGQGFSFSYSTGE